MTEWGSYVLWVKYLQTTDPATWTVAVREDFGTCLGQDAAQWASDNRFRLWNGPKGARKPRPYRDQALMPTELAVVIDVTAPDAVIAEHVNMWIAHHREDCGITVKQGRPTWTPRRGKWQLSRQVDDSAAIALEAWHLRQEMTLAKVGSELSRRHPIGQAARRDNDSKELSTIAAKYIRQAEAIRERVVQGVFPA